MAIRFIATHQIKQRIEVQGEEFHRGGQVSSVDLGQWTIFRHLNLYFSITGKVADNHNPYSYGPSTNPI